MYRYLMQLVCQVGKHVAAPTSSCLSTVRAWLGSGPRAGTGRPSVHCHPAPAESAGRASKSEPEARRRWAGPAPGWQSRWQPKSHCFQVPNSDSESHSDGGVTRTRRLDVTMSSSLET